MVKNTAKVLVEGLRKNKLMGRFVKQWYTFNVTLTYFMCPSVCLPIHVYVPCARLVPEESKTAAEPLELELWTVGCELPCRYWEPNQGLAQEQQVLSIAEPALQLPCSASSRNTLLNKVRRIILRKGRTQRSLPCHLPPIWYGNSSYQIHRLKHPSLFSLLLLVQL